MTRELHRLGISALAAGYIRREFTAAEVIDHALARIAELDPGFRSFIQVDAVGAREAAGESDRQIATGALRPLEGVPIAIKANIDVAGLETNAGMEARRGMIPEGDAETVSRLRHAGAVILGTLNMHEAALGADSDNPWFGRVINPHGLGRTPGGSSGGSGAAVAAGFCVAALGTDTLGSVRIPAAYCGVYGLKPGSGTVSQRGLELVAARFDTIGPLARSLDDLEAVANVIADLPPPRPVDRVATLDSLDDVQCDPAVAEAYRRGLSAVAAAGVPRGGSLKLDLKPIRLAGFVEAAQELGRTLENLRSRYPERFSDSLAFLLDYGARSTCDAALLEQVRHEVTAAVGSGVLLMPTAPQAAFVHGSRAPANQADFTALASIAGLPALSIPAGVDGKGMPVAVQLVGVRGNELGLINLARLLEPQLGGAIRPTIF